MAGVDAYTGIENPFPVFSRISDCDVKADVVIDFSNAGAADALLDWCVSTKTPVVLCTTGLSPEQLERVEEAAKETAVLKSANMSVGINLLLKLLKEAAPTLAAAGFDIEIVEKHHNQKLDAPSGTAITLAEGILENLDRKDKWVMGTLTAPDGTVSGTTECKPDELPVSAIRKDEVPGIHTVRYESEADSIIITHDAKNRKGFALGPCWRLSTRLRTKAFLGMNDYFNLAHGYDTSVTQAMD